MTLTFQHAIKFTDTQIIRQIPEIGLEPYGMNVHVVGVLPLDENKIHNGDCVLLNTGENCERAAWFKKEVLSL